jgi:uncharacterized protein
MAAPDRSRRQRVKTPYHVMIKACGPVCNLECSYCYYLEKMELFPSETRFRMDEALLERFIRAYIGSHPGPNVIFPWHGGEPTVLGIPFFEKAVELQRKYLPAGWNCINVPQTNGTLLDGDWCRFFAEQNFAIGISIDGPAEFHDACRPDKRGRPTHERVMRGLRLLQEHGVPHSVLCTVNRFNVGAPLETYRFFREHGVTAIQFLPIVNSVGDGAVSPETVPAAAYGRFLAAIMDEWLRRDFGRVWVQIFEECLLKARGDPGTLCLFQETCGDSLAMEHNGDLFACDHFVTEEYRLGNIRTRPIKALVESPRLKRFARAKQETLPACCRACDVRFMCNGGCPKDRFLTSPEGEPGLNYLCEGFQLFFRHARTRLQALSPARRRAPTPGPAQKPAPAPPPPARGTPGRNDPCPCGSGRKYKRCCGASPHPA